MHKTEEIISEAVQGEQEVSIEKKGEQPLFPPADSRKDNGRN